uniref:AbaSI family restriction endonuclease n=1 Tax=Rheinheimera sp. TaxID=1869214 RepID=UPI0040474B71
MNCPRCNSHFDKETAMCVKYCVCGYNFQDPENSTIHANERFIHGNTRTSHKSYESIVVYALHYALRDVEILSQYAVTAQNKTFFIDAYIPALNLAVEVDEPFHNNQKEEDALRQQLIEEKLKCEFIRVSCSRSLYEQVDEIVKRVHDAKLSPWQHKPKRININNGEFKQKHIDELESNNIPELMNILAEEFEQEGVKTVSGSVFGIPSPSNGELGFLVKQDGLTVAIYGRKTGKINVRVVGFDESVPKRFVDEHLHPRQIDEKKYGGPRYYALPDNNNAYNSKDIAKEKFYDLKSRLSKYKLQ